MCSAVQGHTRMHKGVQKCVCSPWHQEQGEGQSAAVLSAPQRGSVPLCGDLQHWNLTWLPCTHHAQGMLRFVPGFKIISLGTLGKKEVISVTALPKHLSPCTALARLLLLRISHCQEGLLRTSSTLFLPLPPRHNLSSGAAATAPPFSVTSGRGGRWRPRYCWHSTHTQDTPLPPPSSRLPSSHSALLTGAALGSRWASPPMRFWGSSSTKQSPRGITTMVPLLRAAGLTVGPIFLVHMQVTVTFLFLLH